MKNSVTGVILAGGRSSRMGTNKAFLNVGKGRLIDKIMGVFLNIFPEIIIVTNSPLDYLEHNCVIVTDLVKGKGALGGIYTGVFFASHDHVFISACDMPFLNTSFIEYMVDRCKDNDIVVPKPGDGLQPLHAIYSKKCLPHIQKAVLEERLKITSFYKGLNYLEIQEEVINSYDKEGKMFINVNTKEDLGKLL